MGKLVREAVVANYATTASDWKTYQIQHFNLDVIISVGYIVKSIQGTQFRYGKHNDSKTKLEYKKYKDKTLEQVEKEYLKTINALEQQAKIESQKKRGKK